MKMPNLTNEGRDASRRDVGRTIRLAVAALAAGAASGCVQVTAPDRPIVINLNINIRQEVVVRLQDDARRLIQNNPEVF
jgi:hypothetical protein